MTTLTIPSTTNFIAGLPGGQTDVTQIDFTNPTSTSATATFSNTQFNNVIIKNNVKFFGSSGTAQVVVNGGSLDASLWTFSGWASSDDITLNGGIGADTIVGSSQADFISAASGNDLLNGGAGQDTLVGSFGNDTLIGGSGNDIIFGNDSLSAQDGGEDVYIATIATDGADKIYDVETLDYSALGAANGITTVYSLGGAIWWLINIAGGDTDTIVEFEPSVEYEAVKRFIGGAGNDSITGVPWAANGFIDGGAGNDTLVGDRDFNVIGADTLIGGLGNDMIYGNDEQSNADGGADVYVATSAVDGFDDIYDMETLDYSALGAANAISLNIIAGASIYYEINITGGNQDRVFLFTPALGGLDRISIFRSGAGDDTISGIVAVDGGLIDGGAGNDWLIGGALGETLDGGTGNDQLDGNADNDALNGGAGNDFLTGGAGNDSLNGGADFDYANYLDASTTAGITLSLAIATAQNTGGAGTDALTSIEGIYGSNLGDTLTGDGAAVNALYGWGGADSIVGNAGFDYVEAGEGDDTIDGGAGDDYLLGGNGLDTVTFAAAGVSVYVDMSGASAFANSTATGFDVLSGVERVIGSSFGDFLFGSAGADTLSGGVGIDILYGFGLGDSLDGGGDTDYIVGGAGADTITTGAGQDYIYFQGQNEGKDTVTDWRVSGFDLLVIDEPSFGAGLITGQYLSSESWRFVAGTAATAAFGQFLWNSATSTLSWDADGTGAGAAVQLVTLTGIISLTAGDILVL